MNRTKKLRGVIDGFFETGCEGILWVFIEDKADLRNMHELVEGDHLTVFAEDGAKSFDGKIECDRKIGWTAYPGNKKRGQQAALGYWVHWIQRGWQPDGWARLFLRRGFYEGRDPLRAELIKKPRQQRREK